MLHMPASFYMMGRWPINLLSAIEMLLPPNPHNSCAPAQERFTEALLRDMAKVPFPSERIYSQTVSGKPKSEVLGMLQARHPDTKYHFIEDKLSTLEKVSTALTVVRCRIVFAALRHGGGTKLVTDMCIATSHHGSG